MCPGSNLTQISTPVHMLTRIARSFCLCCFWQVVRHLWSLQLSGIPHHMDLHPSRNVYLTSWFILSVLFLTGGETSVVTTRVPDHRHIDLHSKVAISTQAAGSFCLCCFWQAVRHLWSLQLSGIPPHTDLHPSRNINPNSWFILSVLFLTGGETSVLPTHVRDSPSHGPPPW